jgi:hypothetical protein
MTKQSFSLKLTRNPKLVCVGLAVSMAGCLLILAGLRGPGRAVYERAVREKVQTQLELLLPEPLDLVVQAPGADPFADQPDSISLRLRVVTEDGASFSSKIQRSQIMDLPPSIYNHNNSRFLSWQAVIEGVTSEEARLAAARIGSIKDWRRVERLDADLVTKDGEVRPMPGSVEISLCRAGYSLGAPVLKVFVGTKTSEEGPAPSEVSVVAYSDPSGVAKRLAEGESGFAESILTCILAGSVVAGVLLVAAGAGLLFLMDRSRVKQVDQAEVSSTKEPIPCMTENGFWLPPWFWMVVQVAVLFVVQGHMDYFQLGPEGTEMGQREWILYEDLYLANNLASDVGWNSFLQSLTKERTFFFPLLINGVRSLNPSLGAWPFCELAVRVLAVFVFFLGLRLIGVSGWLTLGLSSALLYSTFRWDADHRHYIFFDLLAESLAVSTIGMLLVVVGRPRKILAWAGLTLSLFLTYQGRPAYLFLIGLVPILGVLLSGLFWQRAHWLRRRLQMGIGLIAVGAVPYVGWCTLRWLLIGHFGLVSMGGYTAVHIPGLFLSEDVIPDLPEDFRPLARAVLQERDVQPNWQSPLVDGWFDPKIVDDEEVFGEMAQSKSGDLIRAKAAELYGNQDWVLINTKLSEFAKALIKARPGYFAKWLLTATKFGIIRMVTSDSLFKRIALLLAILVGFWHFLYVLHRLRIGPVDEQTDLARPRTYFLVLNAMILVAVGFALSSLFLVILVAPPEVRYMRPAGIFLSTVLVVLLFAVGSRVRTLLPLALGRISPKPGRNDGVGKTDRPAPMIDLGKSNRAWKPSLLLGGIVCFVYLATGDKVPNRDRAAAELAPVALVRGDGLVLDHFKQYLEVQAAGDTLPGGVAWARGHLITTDSLAVAALAVPFYLPQIVVLDWFRPGWERQNALSYASRMAKNTAAVIGALAAVAIYLLLRAVGLGPLALATAGMTALASNLWADSQTLGPEVPAALALTFALALLVPEPVSRLRLCLAGVATGAMVWVHPQDLLLAAVICVWVGCRRSRDLVWFLPLPFLVGAAIVGFRFWYFGTVTGIVIQTQGSGVSFLKSAAYGLLSPRRSLFVYCPWIAVALMVAPVLRLRSRSITWWLLWALVPHMLWCLVTTEWWHLGESQSLYFTDLVPLFAFLLALGLSWSWRRRRPVFAVFGLTLAFSAGIQFLGALSDSTSGQGLAAQGGREAKGGWTRDWRNRGLDELLAESPRYLQKRWLSLLGYSDHAPSAPHSSRYEPGTRIDFAKPSARGYLGRGWYDPEPFGRWAGPEAEVKFTLARAQPLRLRVRATTYGKQRIIIRLNGHLVQTIDRDAEMMDLVETELPLEFVTQRNTIQFISSGARSPQSVGHGQDRRILGIGIAWIELLPLPARDDG